MPVPVPFVALLTAEGRSAQVAEFLSDAARMSLRPEVFTFKKNCFKTGSIDSEITKSHAEIMKNCLTCGYDHALIFEDDSRFFDRVTRQDLDNCFEWLDRNRGRWDLFYLGAVHILPPIPVAKGIRWTPAPLLSHSYVISAPFMRKFISFAEHLDTKHPFWNSVDMWYARTGLGKFSASPQLCYQAEIPRNCPIKWGKTFAPFQLASDKVLVLWLAIAVAVLCLVRKKNAG